MDWQSCYVLVTIFINDLEEKIQKLFKINIRIFPKRSNNISASVKKKLYYVYFLHNYFILNMTVGDTEEEWDT